MQSSFTIAGDAAGTSSRPCPGIVATPFYSNLRFLYWELMIMHGVLEPS